MGLWKSLSRRRAEDEYGNSSELARVLDLFDLTALGVGSTLGLGVYVLAGSVAKDIAGPAVCLSFLIAAIASAFAGLCYAEFASRVPKAGSAYIYSYVSVGEFIAFVIGWNLILEYVIGTASVARGVSGYVDMFINHTIERTLKNTMPMNVPYLSSYPDLFAFSLVILLTIFLSIGVKASSLFNNVFTTVNMVTIIIIIVTGITKANPSNWSIDASDIPANVTRPGTGGFMPFGIQGVMEGAAICFYGFVGFDAVAATGEEAINPQRNIPLAIVMSMAIIFFAYIGISSVLTMMWPYYDQNAEAPLPYVYDKLGWSTVKWIVNVGAIFSLSTGMFGSMFPLPRVLYAMGSDGVIFKSLAIVNAKTQTCIVGTVVSGILTGIMSTLFNLDQLINMMSIGTLMAYTIVAISILILRYQSIDSETNVELDSAESTLKPSIFECFKQIFNFKNQKVPTDFSSAIVKFGVLFFGITSVFICILVSKFNVFKEAFLTVALAVTILFAILAVTAIGRQPTQRVNLSFKVPLVPLIPCLSILVNIFLMVHLDVTTWLRFFVWMVAGFMIYFFYGLSHSVQGEHDRLQAETQER